MPTIVRLKKKKDNRPKRGKNKEIQKLYNSPQWSKLRDIYLREHPLCEYCLRKGVIHPALEIHHIKYISSGDNELEMRELAFDYSNLIALCVKHHHLVHLGKITL